jgi:serine/threonine-protein kinase RsbW
VTPAHSSRPPPNAVELHRWALTSGDDLRTLRAALSEALESPLPASLDDLPERVALVATELATNALQHGLPPTTVRLLRHDDCFFVDVADHAPDSLPHVIATNLTDQRGRGMAIARSMALQVGWYISAQVKHVWASFPAAPEHLTASR